MQLTIVNPYARQADRKYTWRKGNLHAHSNRSDGYRTPQEVIDAYAAGGYNFLALTDHDVWTDYTLLDNKGMVLLPAVEVTAFGPHLLQLGGSRGIEPDADRQRVIDQINAVGGMAILNHPNWESEWNHWPLELMLSLNGYAGMEIFNGGCVDEEGSAVAVDKWDRLLSAGLMVRGLANDDSHHSKHDARGWNVVQVPQDNTDAAEVLAAIRAGAFYASTGVTIDLIETDDTTLYLAAANAQEIEVYGHNGIRMAQVSGQELRFDACNLSSSYFRVQCYGQGSQMAWTQPFVIHGGAADHFRAMDEQFAISGAARPLLKALRVDEIPPLNSATAAQLWRKAAVSDVFYDRDTADASPVRTAVSAMISPRELALRVECQEPEMSKVHNRITEDGNNSIWTEESVEIFLDVDGEQKHYYQIVINPAGAFNVKEPRGWGASLKCQKRVLRQSDGWIVELQLDLASLAPGRRIGTGDQFGLHLCRNRHTVRGLYIWSWIGPSNHTPSRFGRLEL